MLSAASAHRAQTMPAEDVAPIVVRAIRATASHVLTHRAPSRPRRRFRALLGDLDFAATREWDPSALGLLK